MITPQETRHTNIVDVAKLMQADGLDEEQIAKELGVHVSIAERWLIGVSDDDDE